VRSVSVTVEVLATACPQVPSLLATSDRYRLSFMTHRQTLISYAWEVWQETHDLKTVLVAVRLRLGCTGPQLRYVERRVKVWDESR
jgi:hypothetical protein